MSDVLDLRDWLERWPYDPEADARLARGADGRPILQVRTPLGIEQYELEGRPDGARPRGAESLLDFHRRRFAESKTAGSAESFRLTARQCAELFEEGSLYYQRYVRLFQLGDWARAVRDTRRNLGLFDFVRRHAARARDREHLEQWRPYLLRMNAAAAAMLEWEAHDHDAALALIAAAREKIVALPELDEETFRFERRRSLGVLEELEQRIAASRPVSELELLERELAGAIAIQAFEQAALLRDRIRALRGLRQEGAG